MPNKASTGSSVVLTRGSLYLSCALYEKYFAGLDAVILLNRDDHLYIMPVRNTSGGGYLLKLRNSSGDRVIIAPDFFREHGLDDFQERDIDVSWDQDMAALKADALFKAAN